ncbi:6-hydroxymethylpterin diphosphokinase MptE-like protein [Robertmurraya sp. GLU-23]
MFERNLIWLSRKFSIDTDLMREFKGSHEQDSYVLISTKIDKPSIQINKDTKRTLIHSKYDPLKEAEMIINQYKDQILIKDNILFYGIGLGYHIEIFLKNFPNKKVYLYEPDPFIFNCFIEAQSLTENLKGSIEDIYIETGTGSSIQFLNSVNNTTKGDLLLIVFPSYERHFPEKTKNFLEAFKESFDLITTNYYTHMVYSKRWIINCLKNVPETLNSPNVFEKSHLFNGKPVVIVSAGPSLYDDLEKLKKIKELGLAYIFAAGSANKSLLHFGITPDAVITYDPQAHNVNVFQELIESGRTDIPMIYGTSVGFETLLQFKGPKLHIQTSVDTVSSNYQESEPEIIINDSMTVAHFALQIAHQLGGEPIILAGQNLAFRENRYYSEGVKYGEWTGEAREEREKRTLLETIDVNGNIIITNYQLNQMRQTIEQYIKSISTEVINTTKNGAAINGARFVPLEKIIKDKLIGKVTVENWWESVVTIDPRLVLIKVDEMEQSIRKLFKSYTSLRAVLTDMYKIINHLTDEKITEQSHSIIVKLNNIFRDILANTFYKSCIQFIMKNEYDQLNRKIEVVNKEVNVKSKLKRVINIFGVYLEQVRLISEEMSVHLQLGLHRSLKNKYSNWKYEQLDYCFLEGDWEKKKNEFDDFNFTDGYEKKIIYDIGFLGKGAGSNIKFKFKGTGIRIIASVHPFSNNYIQIKIDNEEQIFSTKVTDIYHEYSANIQQTVFVSGNLEEKVHDVEIRLMDDSPFAIEGIEINKVGRILHPDEVTTVSELQVGKRIRCHYIAGQNEAGTFSNIGKESSSFIPVDSEAKPNGDFYFIMVDEIDGKKILVADRNIQHSISWDQLHKQGYIFGKNVSLGNHISKIRSLMGGIGFIDNNQELSMEDQGLGAFPIDNEWDKYIYLGTVVTLSNWNITEACPQSWCQEIPVIGLIHPYSGEVLSGTHEIKRVFRTKMNNGAGLSYNISSQSVIYRGFRPVLEL